LTSSRGTASRQAATRFGHKLGFHDQAELRADAVAGSGAPPRACRRAGRCAKRCRRRALPRWRAGRRHVGEQDAVCPGRPAAGRHQRLCGAGFADRNGMQPDGRHGRPRPACRSARIVRPSDAGIPAAAAIARAGAPPPRAARQQTTGCRGGAPSEQQAQCQRLEPVPVSVADPRPRLMAGCQHAHRSAPAPRRRTEPASAGPAPPQGAPGRCRRR
jgi:hypothetical protein